MPPPFPPYKPLPSSRIIICCMLGIQYSRGDLAWCAEGTRSLPFVQHLRAGHTQCSETVPRIPPGWGCQLQKATIPTYTGSGQSLVSAKWIVDILTDSMRNFPGTAVIHATWLPALVFHDYSQTGNLEGNSLPQNQKRLSINVSFVHTGQPSSAVPSIC